MPLIESFSRLRPSTLWSSPRMRLLRMAPRVDARLSLLAGAGMILGAVLPTASTVISGALVGGVPDVIRSGFDSAAGRRVLHALAAMAALYVAQLTLVPLTSIVTGALGRRVNRRVTNDVMESVLTPPGIGHLEDPVTQDQIAKATSMLGTSTPGDALTAMLGQWTSRMSGVGGVVILCGYSVPLAIALAVVAIVDRVAWRRRYDEVTAAFYDQGQIHRRSAWFRDMAMSPASAKEVRAFALDAWFVRSQHEAWVEALAPVWPKMRNRAVPVVLFVLRGPVVAAAVMAMLARSALLGSISLGALVVYLQASQQARSLGGGSADQVVSSGVAALPFAQEIARRLRAPETTLPGDRDATGLPSSSIRFENVRFRYPGRNTDVFDSLDIDIPVGRSLAVVGANGAGKTTLVKLLARLHDPVEGRIAVDGIDLRSIDPGSWQRRIAAIFQDFQQYQLSARDNVAFGAPDLQSDDATLDAAAARAGATGIVDALANRWDTPLSKLLKGGTDLSGGQWQRVALARAMFAVSGGAAILVLDEPTANLDVRAEAELYDRFLDVTSGLTTIVISHRFSTVRRADSIVVLDAGRVVERGTHDELVAAGGLYAQMFGLQAARFAEDTSGG